jgi:hypothetical protein
MKIYVVAINDGEYANTAYLSETTSFAKKTIAKYSRAFVHFEKAQKYAKEWAAKEGMFVSTRNGSGGITIFEVEMDEDICDYC